MRVGEGGEGKGEEDGGEGRHTEALVENGLNCGLPPVSLVSRRVWVRKVVNEEREGGEKGEDSEKDGGEVKGEGEGTVGEDAMKQNHEEVSRECVCVCVCVCEREREKERAHVMFCRCYLSLPPLPTHLHSSSHLSTKPRPLAPLTNPPPLSPLTNSHHLPSPHHNAPSPCRHGDGPPPTRTYKSLCCRRYVRQVCHPRGGGRMGMRCPSWMRTD